MTPGEISASIGSLQFILDKCKARLRIDRGDTRFSEDFRLGKSSGLTYCISIIEDAISDLCDATEAQSDKTLDTPLVPTVTHVILGANGMLGVFDQNGSQIPSLQGKFTDKLRSLLWDSGYRGVIECPMGELNVYQWAPKELKREDETK